MVQAGRESDRNLSVPAGRSVGGLCKRLKEMDWAKLFGYIEGKQPTLTFFWQTRASPNDRTVMMLVLRLARSHLD